MSIVNPNHLRVPPLAWDLGASSLMLLLPMAIFLKHNDYPIFSPEILITWALVLLTGLFWGLLMHWGGQVGRMVVSTLLLILVVDIQTDWITTLGLRLLICSVVFTSLTWLIRKRISEVLVCLFATMLLVTLIMPSGRMVHKYGTFPGLGSAQQPFVLHLILDEYAAPEALDQRFDPGNQFSASVQSFFLDHNFTLFTRAYSRFYDTNESIPNTLNRGLRYEPDSFWQDGFSEGVELKQNDWFDRLDHLGYDLHVIQPNFIDFATSFPQIKSFTNYHLETVHSLIDQDLAVRQKVKVIFGTYHRLSWLMGRFRDGYSQLSSSAAGKAIHLPPWQSTSNRFSSLSTMGVMDDLTATLKRAQPGQAMFAHLELPHYPYAFTSECTLKPRIDQWLNGSSTRCSPARNDANSRAERYPMYLEQIQCTNNRLAELFSSLQTAGVWDNALVIIHGDHGSRLNMAQPFPEFAGEMVETDYMDAFGTLLAIKFPKGEGKIDRNLVPLTNVFEQVFLASEQSWPPTAYVAPQDILAAPWVFLNDRQQKMERHPMPSFEHGLTGNQNGLGEPH